MFISYSLSSDKEALPAQKAVIQKANSILKQQNAWLVAAKADHHRQELLMIPRGEISKKPQMLVLQAWSVTK